MTKTALIAIAAAAATCIGTIAIVNAKDAVVALRSDAGDNTAELIERGSYIAKIGGCHDCHTPMFALKGGKVDDQSTWLVGDTLGSQGPWGTTYPANLRLFVNRMSEKEWLEFSSTFQARPPMPWFNVHAMSELDRKAFYYFVRSLGPTGEMAPAYVPPGVEPQTPVVRFPQPPVASAAP